MITRMHTHGADVDAVENILRDQFLAWQCRIRQFAVRRDAGRPGPGMRPQLYLNGQKIGPIVVVINKRSPETIAAEFRHVYLRTVDPVQRMESVLQKLAEAYYQHASDFSDELAALFPGVSPLADALLKSEDCRLEFEHARQRYVLPCTVRRFEQDDPAYQVTYWHNCLFNPHMPSDVQVLGFQPQWRLVEADPSPL